MVKKIVIVGGGFAGVGLALKLANNRNFDIKLICKENYFQYHAALYRSATGRSPLEVVIPLKDFFEYAKNIEMILDEVTEVNSSSKQITGTSECTYQYDELVLALGNNTEYYSIRGLEKYSYGVKDITEALKLKRHIHDNLLNKQKESAYVVVGGGASGVELSAELMSYLKKVRKRHRASSLKYSVYLIEASDRVLKNMPERFSKKVQKRLKKVGVQLLLNNSVQYETAGRIKLPNSSISTQTVSWTAGVTNNPLFEKHTSLFKLGKLKRVIVNSHLEADPNIYVLGDSASTEFSGMAQTALHDARFVANNFKRKAKRKKLKAYKAKKPVYAVPVGSRWAAVLWGHLTVYGRLGWILRRLADLRLYLTFLSLKKALTAWKYGNIKDEEVCPKCSK